VAPVVVGVVVIGLGTSAPELLVSGVAAAHGNTGLAVGNLVGSNVVNLTLILGIAALVAPLAVRSSVPAREAPMAFAATVALAGLAWLGLGLPAGIVLGALGLLATVLLIRIARVPAADPMPDEVVAFLGPRRRSVIEAARALLGLAGTLAGAQLVVANAATLAHHWGMSDAVIGFTVVAFGTSLPEFVTAVQAQRRGEPDLVVGNLLGSNLFNSLAGGAIVGLLDAGPARFDAAPALLAMVAVTGLAWLVLRRGYRVSRLEGLLLIVLYGGTVPFVAA
jgi:cation:H+ antiporter